MNFTANKLPAYFKRQLRSFFHLSPLLFLGLTSCGSVGCSDGKDEPSTISFTIIDSIGNNLVGADKAVWHSGVKLQAHDGSPLDLTRSKRLLPNFLKSSEMVDYCFFTLDDDHGNLDLKKPMQLFFIEPFSSDTLATDTIQFTFIREIECGWEFFQEFTINGEEPEGDEYYIGNL